MTTNETTYTLAASSNRGRFALNHANGPDISNGQLLSIFLAGNWIPGSVEHKMDCYPGQMLMALFEKPAGPAVIGGYYFISSVDGSISGLCIGMKVRLR